LSGVLKKIIRAEEGAARYLPLASAFICWAAALIFVKYFSTLMDVETQNFFRYFGASVFLTILVSLLYPGCFRKYLKNWRVYFILGGMVAGFQICWVNSLYRVEPAFVSLLSKLSTLLITLMAFVFYKDERVVIRNPRFLAGIVLGVAGMTGVVAGISNFKVGLQHTQKVGIAFLITSSVIWSVYINTVKRVLRTENSLIAFTFTCISATLFFFPVMLVWGNPSDMLHGSNLVLTLVFVSGVIGIAGANSSYYLSIKRIGMARSANLVLAHPFLVALASYLFFGERLTVVQWMFGVILLAGCGLVISVRAEKIE